MSVMYTSNDRYFGYYDGKGIFQAEGVDVVLVKYEKVLETNNVFVTAEFYIGDQLQSVRSSMNEIVKDIGNAGYPLSNAQTSHLFSYIQQQLNNMNAVIVHETLGWYKYKEKTLFLGSKAQGITSNYIGVYDIEPRGKTRRVHRSL